MPYSKGQTTSGPASTATRVVEHVRSLIESGRLKRGDRLPTERELSTEIGVSRPSLRSGLKALHAMGVIVSRQGDGTYVSDGPPKLEGGALRFLAALHGFTRDEMFEARQMLEVGAAGLAAERAEAHHLHALAEEVAAMYAHIDDPQQYLVHDVQFHSAIAAASRNPVLATLVETVAGLNYERRKLTVERAHDLKESAAMHRRIYLAIKAADPTRARAEMRAHLDLARQAQASEELAGGRRSAPAGPEAKPSGARGPSSRRRR